MTDLPQRLYRVNFDGRSRFFAGLLKSRMSSFFIVNIAFMTRPDFSGSDRSTTRAAGRHDLP